MIDEETIAHGGHHRLFAPQIADGTEPAAFSPHPLPGEAPIDGRTEQVRSRAHSRCVREDG